MSPSEKLTWKRNGARAPHGTGYALTLPVGVLLWALAIHVAGWI